MKLNSARSTEPPGASCLPTTRFLLVVIPIFSVIISCAQKQGDLKAVEASIINGSASVSDVLGDQKYLSLHGDPDFREIIRKNAPTGTINVVTPSEPGTRITLRGKIIGKDERPRKNVLFYFYHTMNDGLYAVNTSEPGKPFQGQQEMARLFGYMRTDDNGAFEIRTIKPAGYPGTKFPSHVHLEIYDDSGKPVLGTEFQFLDDPRLDKKTRANSIRYGNLVSDNSGTKEKPVYLFTITLP